MKKINYMELFGGVFIVFGVLSAFILIVIFDGSTDIMYLLGYFSIPLILLAIGFLLVSLSSGKVKNAIEKPVELPIQEHVMFLNTPKEFY